MTFRIPPNHDDLHGVAFDHRPMPAEPEDKAPVPPDRVLIRSF
jgi:hypothetical protein